MIDLNQSQILVSDNQNHSSEICGAAWCDNRRLVTASRDGKIVLWHMLPEPQSLFPYVAWHSGAGIKAIDVSADGKQLYVASASESISVFNLAELEAEFRRLGIDALSR